MRIVTGGVAERPCVRLQNRKYNEDSEYIRVRIPSPPSTYKQKRLTYHYFKGIIIIALNKFI